MTFSVWTSQLSPQSTQWLLAGKMLSPDEHALNCLLFTIFLATFLCSGTTSLVEDTNYTKEDPWRLRSPLDSPQETFCDQQSFALYDGYHLVASQQEREVKLELSTNLPECLHACLQRQRCRGINYDGQSCQLLDDTSGGQILLRYGGSKGPFGIYAQKICITDKRGKCADRKWAFEHILGHHLANSPADYFIQRKQVTTVKSATHCGQLCLDEANFVCRSALYNGTSGDCLLTNMDRNTVEGNHSDQTEARIKLAAIVPLTEEVHYLENKCIQEPRKFCDFRKLANISLRTVDSTVANVDSLGECRELCLANSQCRSYQLEASRNSCRLSHLSEQSTWHIKDPYFEEEGTSTFEISTCYNVSIYCEPKSMKVHIETSKLFSGKIYAKSQPKQCVNDVTNQLNFDVSLPYVDSPRSALSATGPQCDTRQPEPGNFANDIIIQHHDKVLTTKDLALGVYCKFDLQNDSITRIDLKIQGEILTDKLKGTAQLPDLSLHVVDIRGRDINEVSIGDVLRVQIRMSDEATYGIFVRNLIARDSFNQTNNFTLIDGKGCPVEMKMMREVRTLTDSKSLESYLEAFTFTGGSLLVIEAEVETCLDKCRPMHCHVATGRSDDHPEVVTSYGRRRRRSIVTDEEQAEKGDILSMTMLTKSLLIRPHGSGTQKPKLSSPSEGRHLSIPRKWTTTANTGSSQSPKVSFKERLGNRSKAATVPVGLKAKERMISRDMGSVAFRLTSTEKDYICFEPLNLMLICCFSFCVQALIFTVLFYVLLRRSKACQSGSASSPSSTRLYPVVQPYSFMR